MKKSLLTSAFILILFTQSTFCNKKPLEDYKYRRECYINLKNRLQAQLNTFKDEK